MNLHWLSSLLVRALSTAIIVCLLALVGCQPAPPSPRSTLQAWAAALRRDRPLEAYALFSRAERQRVTAADFSSRWRDAAHERAPLLAALESATPRVNATVNATSNQSDAAQTRTLGVEAGGWRVLDPQPSAGNGLHTVAEVVSGLASALEHHNLDALYPLLSPALKQAIDRELADRIKGLRALQPVVGDSDHLKLHYGSHFLLQLRKTGEVWQVDDLN